MAWKDFGFQGKGNQFLASLFDAPGALPSKGASIEGLDAETKVRYDDWWKNKSNVAQ